MMAEIKDKGAKIWAIRFVVFIFLPIFVSGCELTPYYEEIHLYDGPNLPRENLAALQESFFGPIHYFTYIRKGPEIETIYSDDYQYKGGRKVIIWKYLLLLPGEYQIGAYVWKKGDCGYDFYDRAVDLQAGHLYVLKSRLSYSWDGRCRQVWLEDEATGEIVAGQDGR